MLVDHPAHGDAAATPASELGVAAISAMNPTFGRAGSVEDLVDFHARIIDDGKVSFADAAPAATAAISGDARVPAVDL